MIVPREASSRGGHEACRRIRRARRRFVDNFASLIRKRMKALGADVCAIAKLAKIRESTMAGLLNGTRIIYQDEALNIAFRLGIPFEEVLVYEGDGRPPVDEILAMARKMRDENRRRADPWEL